jgi:hypothetical protein
MQKELPNGQANQRLAGDEQRWVSPQHRGRNGDEEGCFGQFFASYRRRRERGSGPGPACRRRSADTSPIRWNQGATLGLLFCATDDWASVWFSKSGMSPKRYGPQC